MMSILKLNNRVERNEGQKLLAYSDGYDGGCYTVTYVVLPAGGQEQEHQGQTQVSQMTLIAGERYPQQLHREMMINQVLENMHLTQSQMVRATMIHQGLVLETKLKILHQNMVQMWDKLLAVASLTETIHNNRDKEKTN